MPLTDREALLVVEYRPLAYRVARDFFITSSEPDDVRQEALVGLLEAIRQHDPSRGLSLRNFVVLVVRRRLIDVLTYDTRTQRGPLTDSVRVVVSEDGDIVPIIDLIEDPRTRDLVDARESLHAMLGALPSLSVIEREALTLAVNGVRWSVGGRKSVAEKRIDNALQRARAKLQKAAA